MTQKIAMALALILFFATLGLMGELEATYTLGNCEVVEIEGNVATAEDNRGNQWSFYIDKESELGLGDEVDLVIDNNHTEHTRTDDEVKRVKLS